MTDVRRIGSVQRFLLAITKVRSSKNLLLLVLLTKILQGVSEVLISKTQKHGNGQDPKPVHFTAKAISLRFFIVLHYHLFLRLPNRHF